MKETKITRITAELAKEKGVLKTFNKIITQSLLQKFIREKYNIHFHIWFDANTKEWSVDLYDISVKSNCENCAGLLNNPFQFTGYKTYEAALEIGLRAALNKQP
jgi:hypothetical protein